MLGRGPRKAEATARHFFFTPGMRVPANRSKNMGKYFGNWDKYEGVVEDLFAGEYDCDTGQRAPATPDASFPKDEDVVFACYTYKSYSGSATILYTRDGQLFEFGGGHCSCNGLEGQWGTGGGPVTWDALALRNYGSEDDYETRYYPTAARDALVALIAENATPALKA